MDILGHTIGSGLDRSHFINTFSEKKTNARNFSSTAVENISRTERRKSDTQAFNQPRLFVDWQLTIFYNQSTRTCHVKFFCGDITRKSRTQSCTTFNFIPEIHACLKKFPY